MKELNFGSTLLQKFNSKAPCTENLLKLEILVQKRNGIAKDGRQFWTRFKALTGQIKQQRTQNILHEGTWLTNDIHKSTLFAMKLSDTFKPHTSDELPKHCYEEVENRSEVFPPIKEIKHV